MLEGSRVACLVRAVPSGAGMPQPKTDALAVEIRVPDAPPPAALAGLSAEARRVERWPIEIRLDGAPSDTRPLVLKSRRVVPGADAPSLVLRTPGGSAAMFLRVSYPRAVLRAGVQIIAARRAPQTRPEAATETRCAITAKEVALWP